MSTLLPLVLQKSKELDEAKKMLEKKQKSVETLQKKIDLAIQVKSYCSKADDEMRKIGSEVRDLLRLLAKVEWAASQVNSRHNSTPEIRQINQQIDEVLEEIHKQERAIAVLQVESSSLQNDIDTKKVEQDDMIEAAIARFGTLYNRIQTLRQQTSQTRYDNLCTYIENDDFLVEAEIEIQEKELYQKMYNQLCKSFEAEFLAYTDSEKGPLMLTIEAEKIALASNSIPKHQEFDEDSTRKLVESCSVSLSEIKTIENDIIDSIGKTAEQELETDRLDRFLHDGRLKFKILNSELQEEQGAISELEAKINEKKERDATQASKAQEEICQLEKEISDNQQMLAQIDAKLQELADEEGRKAQMSKSPLQQITRRCEKDISHIKREISNLKTDEQTLKQQIQNREIAGQ